MYNTSSTQKPLPWHFLSHKTGQRKKRNPPAPGRTLAHHACALIKTRGHGRTMAHGPLTKLSRLMNRKGIFPEAISSEKIITGAISAIKSLNHQIRSSIKKRAQTFQESTATARLRQRRKMRTTRTLYAARRGGIFLVLFQMVRRSVILTGH